MTTAMPHCAWLDWTPSVNTFFTYQSTSESMVRLTSLPSTASFDSVTVPGMTSPPLPRW